jgi:hypothetical protein
MKIRSRTVGPIVLRVGFCFELGVLL